MAAFVAPAWLAVCPARAQTNDLWGTNDSRELVFITPGKFTASATDASRLRLTVLAPPAGQPAAFNQSAIKQGTAAARLGPKADAPYFTVRFALPIPPENGTNLTGLLVGMDPAVFSHNHSPGFEILPNGDALAIYFSTPPRQSEAAVTTTFIQARLRCGAEEWDPPELFFDLKDANDQSGLLWQDGNQLRFFGGGRGVTPWLPFKMATSADNGASWTLSLPALDRPADNFTAQPITSAFRGADKSIYLAMDGAKDQSFLWRSRDDGIHWQDMGGRTGGRHSVIEPLDDRGTLLSIGGKNTALNGYSPQNLSTNWGATWSEDQQSPFPALGSNQRPSLIRLANGHLCFVTDSVRRRAGKPPAGWDLGEGCFIAISKDNGRTWHFKHLPVELPHETDRQSGTLGYATVRQAPNGIIHVLATMTHPCLHYEMNEAWIFSEAGDLPPETSGGRIETFREKYPNGSVRTTWTARICPNGRYLLDGPETSYYENGRKEHEVVYASGRKTGRELFWAMDGTKVWEWKHDPAHDASTWIQYWSNGRKRVESNWNTRPRARDLARNFFGLTADGASIHYDRAGGRVHVYHFTNGALDSETEASARTE